MGRVVALIPAKGRSRRAPGKNIAPLAGVPLFAHAVRLAKNCTLVDEVVVSSDDDAILDVARSMSVKAWKRAPELCRDDTTNFEVCSYVLGQLREQGEVDILILLEPTRPFRTPGPVDEAIRLLKSERDADSLVTVVPDEQVLCTMNGNWLQLPSQRGQRLRNPSPPLAIVGHLFALRPERTFDNGVLLGENILPFHLPDDWLNVDIDTPNELMIAQEVAQAFFEQRFPI